MAIVAAPLYLTVSWLMRRILQGRYVHGENVVEVQWYRKKTRKSGTPFFNFGTKLSVRILAVVLRAARHVWRMRITHGVIAVSCFGVLSNFDCRSL